MSKSNKTPKTSTQENSTQSVPAIPVNGIWGVLLFVVCISIGYNTFLVLTGTDGLLNQIMSAPGVLFIIGFMLYKAWK